MDRRMIYRPICINNQIAKKPEYSSFGLTFSNVRKEVKVE